MYIKNEAQRFVFLDGSYQDYPHETEQACAIVFVTDDLVGKKVVDGLLVSKTPEELASERQLEAAELDARHKESRKTALMSFDLTIFNPTTLSQAEQDNVLRVRQEWMDMTTQVDYPFTFVTPEL